MKLIYIKHIGQNINKQNIYTFLFAPYLQDEVDYNYEPEALQETKIPNFVFSKTITTELTLSLIQDSPCFGMRHAIDGIIAIAYENMDGYEFYPEDGRLVLHFGLTYEQCVEKLNNKGISFEETE